MRWVFYTSGTTADPKGAQHTDLTVLVSALAMSECLDLEPADVSGLVFPFTHIGGIGWLMAALVSGCQHGDHRGLRPLWPRRRCSRDSDVTLAGSGTPFHMAYLAAQRAAPDSRLFPQRASVPRRWSAEAAATAPRPERRDRRGRDRVGLRADRGARSSAWRRAAIPTTSSPTPRAGRHRGSPSRSCRSTGTSSGAGTEGELRVKGPQVMRGYLDSSLDADAFDEEGFFRTGDLGVLDEEGYVVVTGRLKDVIIRHGENISAKEVEDLVYQHPSVADVAVVGLPDARTGERACAVVALRPDADEARLSRTCGSSSKEKACGVQAVPEQLEIVDTVPRNPAGKILKHKLREQLLIRTPQARRETDGDTRSGSPAPPSQDGSRARSPSSPVRRRGSGVRPRSCSRPRVRAVACLDITEKGLERDARRD